MHHSYGKVLVVAQQLSQLSFVQIVMLSAQESGNLRGNKHTMI